MITGTFLAKEGNRAKRCINNADEKRTLGARSKKMRLRGE